MWQLLTGVGAQLRMAIVPTPDGVIAQPVGLDFGAVLALGGARGVDAALLAAVLPEVEAAIVAPDNDPGGGDDSDE